MLLIAGGRVQAVTGVDGGLDHPLVGHAVGICPFTRLLQLGHLVGIFKEILHKGMGNVGDVICIGSLDQHSKCVTSSWLLRNLQQAQTCHRDWLHMTDANTGTQVADAAAQIADQTRTDLAGFLANLACYLCRHLAADRVLGS